MILFLFTITLLISAAFTRHLCHPKTIVCILDQPNERSLHTQPTPSTGGLAIILALTFASFLIQFIYPSEPIFVNISFSVLLIAGISLLDDWRHVAILQRLGIHFLAACLLLWANDFWLTAFVFPYFTWDLPLWMQIIFSILFVMWMVNLYNFMDGMDGFAGGMAVFGFGTMALLGGLAGQQLFMLLNLLVVAAVLGFLLFNFPPAKIFMGDLGASTLGFLAAAFILWAEQQQLFSLWIGLLIFSPFIVDATVTLLRRLLRGEKVWLAHKTHYYQRLVELGWGHKRTVLWEYGLMVLCSLSATVSLFLPVYGQGIVLISWLFIYCGLIYFVSQLERST